VGCFTGNAEHDLSPAQRARLEGVLRALREDEHAPTAVKDAERAARIHVADSLAGLEVDALRTAGSIADLGAGVGFPGLAIAVALPDAVVSLVESQRRRCEFLERTCAAAGIENARVIRARAEEWREGHRASDAVTARALAPQPVVLEYAAPLLRRGGALVDWRGRRQPEEEHASISAAETLGMQLLEIRRVEPFAGATERHLHIFLKLRDTPERFPRRAGIARKRPLGFT
jgi:16S rRNA (guanine527-N7)-methyltransferase